MMTRVAPLAVVAALATAAAAAPVRDDDGFRIEMRAAGMVTCVLTPKMTTVPAECADLMATGDQLAQQLSGRNPAGMRMVSVAVLRGSSWAAPVMINSTPPTLGDSLASDALDQFVAGAAKGISDEIKQPTRVRSSRPGSKWDPISIAGTPAIRFTVEADIPAPEINRVLSYAIYGARRTYTIAFLTDAAHEAEIRTVAEKMMASVALPSLSTADRSGFGEPSDYERGRRVGFIVGQVLSVGTLIAIAALLGWWLFRRRRR